MLVFDTETGPLSTEYILSLDPFDESSLPPPEPFDQLSIKLGNLKDQAKIDAKLCEAAAEHAVWADAYPQRLEAARAEHTAKLLDRAALSATTGQVLAIGLYDCTHFVAASDPTPPEFALMHGPDETELIREFWSMYSSTAKLIGFNINGFDLPFLVRRSWILGVRVPVDAMDRRWGFNKSLDLLDVYRCGNRQDSISLDALSRSLSVGGKTGNGADFHKLWAGDQQQRQAAIDYLRNDVDLTYRVARKMGVI